MSEPSQPTTELPRVGRNHPDLEVYNLDSHGTLPYDAMVPCVAAGCDHWVFCPTWSNATDALCAECLS